MSDPKIPKLYKRQTPSWQSYQRENFWKLNGGEKVPFNTDPAALEDQARNSLSLGGRYYAHSNAGMSHTHMANRESFYRHRFIPKQLVDTNTRDTTVTLFGHKLSAPIGFAPVGICCNVADSINKIYHNDGGVPVAKVAGELRLAYGLSTAGSRTIEEVAKANDAGAAMPGTVKVDGVTPDDQNPIRFFQLYMPHDDELTVSLMKRAHNKGSNACILTTDTWQLAWRHDDIATSNYAFYRGIGADLGLADPILQKRLAAAGIDLKTQPEEAGAMWIDNVWHGRPWSWDKIPWLIKTWKEISGGKPFMLKGIQSVEDAWKAVEVGCDGIAVSNHAGRQVDGAIASLDALENIVKAGVGEKIVVTFDSGIRGASDVIKALCLGAKFVWVGFVLIVLQSIMGVRHVMRSLLADFDITMAVGGFRSIDEMTRDRLETYQKNYQLMAAKAHL